MRRGPHDLFPDRARDHLAGDTAKAGSALTVLVAALTLIVATIVLSVLGHVPAPVAFAVYVVGSFWTAVRFGRLLEGQR